jgi:hypothetical protein
MEREHHARPGRNTTGFSSFVTTRAVAYCFLPSVTGLKLIAGLKQALGLLSLPPRRQRRLLAAAALLFVPRLAAAQAAEGLHFAGSKPNAQSSRLR